ncbi:MULTISPECIES: YncE family protein [Acidiphilium]|uniref:40-residue YVTN family beta-propeller repeat-containing protein n=1 Tax=Acidiphilium rubrum TaxID=526 RepID=A0A8G2FLR6_ACIRU|nr:MULTISPECIES: beta-propeller fold lactonase family protein [Acidiphilium]MCW8308731.1 beta-propeller fold lactonase family protein [Acidiphilium sp. PA]SIR52085.1 40-residue YVTN family beta-propeller repeat-containing protein [Acidiphilium rubrum]
MKHLPFLIGAGLCISGAAFAGQAPMSAKAPNIPISAHDRVYTADQSSNTVSVFNPETEKLLGVIRLGATTPSNLSPLYTGQLLVHGMGFAPDHRTIAVVSIGSNSVAFIDTATNKVKHVVYVGRSPHEAFYTPDGKEVWVTVRGENYVSVIDAKTYAKNTRIHMAGGPGMTMFRPDGKYGFVCSSFHPVLSVVDVASHKVVATVKQASPFCPDIAVTPDGKQVWFTLKDTGKTQVFSARKPFKQIALLDTGPITNHVNIVRNRNGQFAYISIGGENEIKVYTTTSHPKLVATIPTPDLPHGLWPSGDGKRIYVALENSTGVVAINTLTNKVVAIIKGGQSPQALTYVPDAVPSGPGTENLKPLGISGNTGHLALGMVGSSKPITTVSVNDQGLIDLVEAAVTGLKPKAKYQLALAGKATAPWGAITPLMNFKSNPAGAAIVTAFTPLKTIVRPHGQDEPKDTQQRYLIVRPINASGPGLPVEAQLSNVHAISVDQSHAVSAHAE